MHTPTSTSPTRAQLDLTHTFERTAHASPDREYADLVRLVTWNVNSIRTRLDRVLAFLDRSQTDVLAIQDPLVEKLDVLAVNTYAGWYGGDSLDAIPNLQWEVPADRPLILSEFGADALAGYRNDGARKFSEEYQAEYYRKTLAMADRMASKLRGKDDADLRLPAAPLNYALERIFAAERGLIGRIPLPPGLSLFAVASAT